jgi:hypothetical protein
MVQFHEGFDAVVCCTGSNPLVVFPGGGKEFRVGQACGFGAAHVRVAQRQHVHPDLPGTQGRCRREDPIDVVVVVAAGVAAEAGEFQP